MKPLHDKVLVKRIEGEDVTPGGIVIPGAAKEKPIEGKVIAVGPGRIPTDAKLGERIPTPLSVHVGDRVLFSRFAGSEVKIGGEEMLIIREEDILGVLDA